MADSGAGRLESEAFAGMQQLAHTPDHQPAGCESSRLRIERRQSARDFVRVHEFPHHETIGQQRDGSRRLSCAVRPAQDDDILHSLGTPDVCPDRPSSRSSCGTELRAGPTLLTIGSHN